MTDRELFQVTFGRLHASADTWTEVQKAMNDKKHHRLMSKKALTLALAAVLLLALGVTAYAAGLFRMHVEPATEEELELGVFPVWDEEGTIDYEAGPQFPSEGLTFSLSTDDPVYQTEFRPGWLPAEPNHAYIRGNPSAADVIAQEGKPWDPEGWYSSVSFDTGPRGSNGDLGIRYQIFDANLRPGIHLTLLGEYQIVKTDTWGDLSVTEVEIQYAEFRGQENYVLLFSESQGFLIVVGGSNDLETLEHIARELEIRQTDVPVIDTGSTQGIINIGRG